MVFFGFCSDDPEIGVSDIITSIGAVCNVFWIMIIEKIGPKVTVQIRCYILAAGTPAWLAAVFLWLCVTYTT